MSNETFNNDLDRIQSLVGAWGDRTFPDATNDSITRHLRDEVKELRDALALIAETNPAEEAADCLLLLLHFAHRNGFSLFDAAAAKYSLNTRRVWQTEKNERGYFAHVEPPPRDAATDGEKG